MCSKTLLPKIAITSGDPAGIGPELIIKIAQETFPAHLIIIGNRALFEAEATRLNLPLCIHPYHSDTEPTLHEAGHIMLLDIPHPIGMIPGKPNPQHATYILETLKEASVRCLRQEFSAIVTAPINKAIINEAGIPFTGHTEYFALNTQTQKVVMMLATSKLRVALATTHLPLSKVSAAITFENLNTTLQILHQDLKRYFNLANPKILVCGLNPHAGEGGHIGREEIEIIEPTIKHLQAQGLNISGPYSADTIFTPKYLENADAILAMYHDQGLPVLKYQGFGEAVNITLGLPIIRTSVDHGTGYDIAGKGQANPSSLKLAIGTAIQMSISTMNSAKNISSATRNHYE
ncbi:MAG: 4-hydroxythreonine-4-phosphate dehydrogenase [Legionellaceae bacterium]